MANIVITSDIDSVLVNFGDYAGLPDINTDKTTYPRKTIAQVSKPYQEDFIMLIMSIGAGHQEWHVSYQTVTGHPEVLIIDTINGTAPTTLDQLFDLMSGLIIG
jgi:hypothetical protein